jgi:hypothetical protein
VVTIRRPFGEGLPLTELPLNLREVELTDRPHLLGWDAVDPILVKQLCNTQNAEYVNYRDSLLSRTKPSERFLLLDRYIDREIDVFRDLCQKSAGRVLVLHEVDVFIAYLHSRPGPMLNVFWDRLLRTNHLNALLWIVLPMSCIPHRWPNLQVRVISSETPTGDPIWT